MSKTLIFLTLFMLTSNFAKADGCPNSWSYEKEFNTKEAAENYISEKLKAGGSDTYHIWRVGGFVVCNENGSSGESTASKAANTCGWSKEFSDQQQALGFIQTYDFRHKRDDPDNPPKNCTILKGTDSTVCCDGDPTGGQYSDKVAISEKQKATCDEAVTLVQKCTEERESAGSKCDPSEGELGTYTQNLRVLNGFGAPAMAMTVNSSINGLCQNAASLMSGMNVALAAFQATCEYSRNACVTSCKDVVKKMKNCPDADYGTSLMAHKDEMEKYSNECHSFGSRTNEAAQNATMAMASFKQANDCAQITKAMNMSMCSRNPFAPGCTGRNQTCDDPAFAASNAVCICMRNPNDPKCGGSAAQQANLPTPGGSVPTLKTAGMTGENIGAGLDPTTGGPLGAGANGAAGGAGEDPGGKKGSGAPLPSTAGGGNGGGPAGRSGGAGFEKDPVSVYSGNYGSSGGSAGSGFSRPGNYTGTGGLGGNRVPGAVGAPNYKFNPAMMGMTGVSGLTGPNGVSIWQKVSNRYKAKEHSMKGVAP